MSDSFAGLTRRINAFMHDRETTEELSHLVEEAQDIGGDAADALIELALGEEHIEDGDGDVDEGLDAILEDDELLDDEDGDGDVDEDDIDAALDDIGNLADLEDEDDDDENLGEAAGLLDFEVAVI